MRACPRNSRLPRNPSSWAKSQGSLEQSAAHSASDPSHRFPRSPGLFRRYEDPFPWFPGTQAPLIPMPAPSFWLLHPRFRVSGVYQTTLYLPVVLFRDTGDLAGAPKLHGCLALNACPSWSGSQQIRGCPFGPIVLSVQKDTVIRKPPKRNMKTKSALRPRKEPSSSMRQ